MQNRYRWLLGLLVVAAVVAVVAVVFTVTRTSEMQTADTAGLDRESGETETGNGEAQEVPVRPVEPEDEGGADSQSGPQMESERTDEGESRSDAPSQTPEPAESEEVEGPSDRLVRVVQHLAWDILPDRIPVEDGEPIEMDLSDPEKYFLPEDEARRIVMTADRSATAALCGLEDEANANYFAMENSEIGSEKWTPEQLHMITGIYNTVMSIRVYGWNQADNEDEARARRSELAEMGATQVTQQVQKAGRDDFDCTDEVRQEVEQEIAEYVTEVEEQ